MKFNNLVFQNPKPSYNNEFENLYKISKNPNNDNTKNDKSDQEYLPFVFIQNEHPVDKAIIYFHGNAEDAAISIDLMNELNQNLGVLILPISLIARHILSLWSIPGTESMTPLRMN
jgi:hypothetical protein